MSNYAASRMVTGPFDEALIARDGARSCAASCLTRPPSGSFSSRPITRTKAAEVLELIRIYGHVTTVVGCSGTGSRRHRRASRRMVPVSRIMLVSLPGATADADSSFDQDMVETYGGSASSGARRRAASGRQGEARGSCF